MGLEDTAQAAAMRRLLMGDEQILQWRHAAREQLVHVPLDDWKVLRMASFDQARGGLAGDQEGGIVAVIDLALVALRQTVADPEHAGRDLAGHFVGHGLVSRFRSSHALAAPSDANFAIKGTPAAL